MKKAIWMMFDFGLKGDFSGLYTWLDNHGAIECGQNLAFFNYSISLDNKVGASDLIEKIKKDFSSEVKLAKSDRVYIIYKDNLSKKMKGKWLNGNRKASPWEGYGKLTDQQTEDEGE